MSSRTISREQYSDYLQSEAWAQRRAKALDRASHRCQLCSSRRWLNVHHNSYDRLGNELDCDLVVLCENCHTVFHVKVDKRTAKKILAKNPELASVQSTAPVVPRIPATPRPTVMPEPGDGVEEIVVTEEFLCWFMGEKNKGGITAKGLKILGFSWPPHHGWRRSVIGTRILVRRSDLERERASMLDRRARLERRRVVNDRIQHVQEDGSQRREVADAYRSHGFKLAKKVAKRFGITRKAVVNAAEQEFGKSHMGRVRSGLTPV